MKRNDLEYRKKLEEYLRLKRPTKGFNSMISSMSWYMQMERQFHLDMIRQGFMDE